MTFLLKTFAKKQASVTILPCLSVWITLDTSVSLWVQTLGKGTFAQSCYKVLFPGREAGAAHLEVCPLCFHLGASLLSPLTSVFSKLGNVYGRVQPSAPSLFFFCLLFSNICEPLYFLIFSCDAINSFCGMWWLQLLGKASRCSISESQRPRTQLHAA